MYGSVMDRGMEYSIFEKRIKAAHHKLHKLENNAAPTIPKYGLSVGGRCAGVITESVTITHDGSGTITATINNAIIGQLYALEGGVSGTAVSSTLILTTSIYSTWYPNPLEPFQTLVYRGPAYLIGSLVIAQACFTNGSTLETHFGTWSSPTPSTVEVAFTGIGGVTYSLQIVDSIIGGSTPVTVVGSSTGLVAANDGGTGIPADITCGSYASLYTTDDVVGGFLI